MKTRTHRSLIVSLLLLVLLSPAISANASLYIYNGYVILNPGTGNTYYDTDNQTANPDFQNNTFTINYGQNLLLGGQVTSDGGGGQPASWGPDWAHLYYSIDGGSYNYVNLNWSTDYGTSGWKVTFEEAGGGMANIGSNLGIGNHSISIYFETHDNTQPYDAYLSNGGANYFATITVVPEPVNVALIGFVILAFFARRFRSCKSASCYAA